MLGGHGQREAGTRRRTFNDHVCKRVERRSLNGRKANVGTYLRDRHAHNLARELRGRGGGHVDSGGCEREIGNEKNLGLVVGLPANAETRVRFR